MKLFCFDLGGGTSDKIILEVGDAILKSATAGDTTPVVD
jgi:molecular chaperone DnaK (HSP70)